MADRLPPLDDPFRVRQGGPADYPLVYSATARSMHASPWYRDVPGDVWSRVATSIVRAHLAYPGWGLWVAHPAEDRAEIAGFLLAKPPGAACMLYVKSPYRHLGVARRLALAAGLGRDVLCVLGSPRAFSIAGAEGYRCRLSPYYL